MTRGAKPNRPSRALSVEARIANLQATIAVLQAELVALMASSSKRVA